MAIMCYWSARSCDRSPRPSGKRDRASQRAVREKPTQGRALDLECVGIFVRGNLLLKIEAGEFVGVGVELLQTFNRMGRARPVDEAQDMFLVGRLCLVGVHLAGGKCPEVFARSPLSLFGLASALSNSHALIQT